MPDAAPFRPIRYDASRVDPAAVTAPPYDVITPTERKQLESASPYNVVRLILGPLDAPQGDYGASRRLLDEWLDNGVLVHDTAASFTVYEETFVVGGDVRRQLGLLAAVEISDDILPHERTMGPIVEDRLAVIRATEANLSPVFVLYWNAEPIVRRTLGQVRDGKPDLDFRSDDGLGHRAWHVTDPAAVEALAGGLRHAKVVIADGHHRYRTAEAYRDERRAADGPGPWDAMLLYMVDAEWEAPALLPIHRLVSGPRPEDALESLRPAFDVQDAPADPDELAAYVQAERASGRCFALLAPGSGYLLRLRDEATASEATRAAGHHSEAWQDLDVAVLHSLVFDRLLAGADVTYVHHPHEVAEALGDGQASFGILLAATPADAVRAVAEARDSMPPKSTFFVPKPRTGIAIRTLRA